MPHAQAPGFYRHRLGQVTVTAINDGILTETAGVLSGIEPTEVATLLSASFLPPVPVVIVNAFLVETGTETVLIDAGGKGMTATVGRLAANLASAGISPADVTVILLTHMHPDHIGGLIDAQGNAVFANARVSVSAADAAVFLDPELAERVPDAAKPVFALARSVASAYAGRLDRFEGEPEIVPGVRAVALPGHSAGHTGYRIESGGETLLIWGDVVHVPGLQFGRPSVGVVFDADPGQAERTRREIFAATAASKELVGGMHLPFPGLGHVVQEEAGYRLVPILWNPEVPS